MNKIKVDLESHQQMVARLNIVFDPLDLDTVDLECMKWQFMMHHSTKDKAYCLEVHNGRFVVKCNGKILANSKFYGL
jgi:hypothetical protein